MKKFIVQWVNGDDLGAYIAHSEDEAILLAVQDAGYSDLKDAAEFVMDERGKLTLCANLINL
jgi:hypothetical protein